MKTPQGRALHTDLYQLTMMQTYVKQGLHHRRGVFDMFFRELPFGNGYAVFAGLQHILDYVTGLEFSPEDLEYLKKKGFSKEFRDYLMDFRFTGDIYSVSEGEIIFPNEPVVTVVATIMEAMLIETALLNIFNHETLIATKASRIKQVVGSKPIAEFGARRGHGLDASLYGSRAAYIGGFDGTSLVAAGKAFDIPIVGTMSHAFIQSFPDELSAFMAYGRENAGNVVLLVDTYNTLKSGIPNVIAAAGSLAAQGITVDAVRLDSGDLAYLSKESRRLLDDAGFREIKILASNDLDENLIMELEMQGAQIDRYAVGTKLITAYDQPALGGVYKLVGIEQDGEIIPKIKISDDIKKIVNPGRKQLYRIINPYTQKAEADYLTCHDENFPLSGRNLVLFDPIDIWKRKTVKTYEAIPLHRQVVTKGKPCLPPVSLEEIRSYAATALNRFWSEHKRKTNPQDYPLDLSVQLWNTKNQLISEIRSHYED
ncbi:MAG: nicotinate phosphoribosyltransferase [delta proteobacterium ML8_F1]|nr:MAG: nicotinate phosphoribosyltransferase [delta proteobacterium ML8_F1]